jgi:hypothetical protein
MSSCSKVSQLLIIKDTVTGIYFVTFNMLENYAISTHYTIVYPEVSGLIAWSENCKWYSSLPLDVIVSLFYESV